MRNTGGSDTLRMRQPRSYINIDTTMSCTQRIQKSAWKSTWLYSYIRGEQADPINHSNNLKSFEFSCTSNSKLQLWTYSIRQSNLILKILNTHTPPGFSTVFGRARHNNNNLTIKNIIESILLSISIYR